MVLQNIYWPDQNCVYKTRTTLKLLNGQHILAKHHCTSLTHVHVRVKIYRFFLKRYLYVSNSTTENIVVVNQDTGLPTSPLRAWLVEQNAQPFQLFTKQLWLEVPCSRAQVS